MLLFNTKSRLLPSKLQLRWIDLFWIFHKLSDGTFLLEQIDGTINLKAVNGYCLKPYFGHMPPYPFTNADLTVDYFCTPTTSECWCNFTNGHQYTKFQRYFCSTGCCSVFYFHYFLSHINSCSLDCDFTFDIACNIPWKVCNELSFLQCMKFGGLIIAYLHVSRVPRIHHALSYEFFTLDTSMNFSIFILFFLHVRFLYSLPTIMFSNFLCFLSCVLSKWHYSLCLYVSQTLGNHGHKIGFNCSRCKSITLFRSASRANQRRCLTIAASCRLCEWSSACEQRSTLVHAKSFFSLSPIATNTWFW